MENEYKISIRLSSDDYVFEKNIKILDNYEIRAAKKGESVIPNNPDSSFRARANVLVIDHIYEKQFSNINIEDNHNELIKIFDIIKDQFKNIDIRKEFYLTCTINNDQFGFEIDTKLINLLSNYGYSLIVSGLVFLD